MFITFEGPEGAGKTTQTARLATSLRALDREVITLREPGGTNLGEAVRRILLEAADLRPSPRAEALLFGAARAQLIADVIEPALARGAVVICDRFGDSSLAYQGGGRGLPQESIAALIDFATAGRAPDLTFLLDLPVEQGFARKTQHADRMERESLEFHRRVRRAYLELATGNPARIVTLDATKSPDDLARHILDHTIRRLQR